MGKKHKNKNNKINDIEKYYDYDDCDPDLPDAPRIAVYQETFGDLKNITEQWYKENEG